MGTNEKRFSAREADIINRAKDRYEQSEEKNRIEELSRLDAEAQTYGQWQALSIGIFGLLVLGTGISMILVSSGHLLAPGIFVSLIGMAVAGMAYPAFRNLNGKKKEELTPRIRQILSELE